MFLPYHPYPFLFLPKIACLDMPICIQKSFLVILIRFAFPLPAYLYTDNQPAYYCSTVLYSLLCQSYFFYLEKGPFWSPPTNREEWAHTAHASIPPLGPKKVPPFFLPLTVLDQPPSLQLRTTRTPNKTEANQALLSPHTDT